MRRELFHELRGLIYPIESFERGIQLYQREFAKPLGSLFRGKSCEIRKFFIQRDAFRGKLVVVLDDLAKKARQKTQWQRPQYRQLLHHKLARQRRIAVELARC